MYIRDLMALVEPQLPVLIKAMWTEGVLFEGLSTDKEINYFFSAKIQSIKIRDTTLIIYV